jgi:hypothetical protein
MSLPGCLAKPERQPQPKSDCNSFFNCTCANSFLHVGTENDSSTISPPIFTDCVPAMQSAHCTSFDSPTKHCSRSWRRRVQRGRGQRFQPREKSSQRSRGRNEWYVTSCSYPVTVLGLEGAVPAGDALRRWTANTSTDLWRKLGF